MKVLAVLSLLQIAAIAFLASRIIALEPTADRPTAATLDEPIAAVAKPDSKPRAVPQTDRFPNEQELRRIVREELAAQLGALSRPSEHAETPAAADPVDAVALQQQLEWVNQEIDRYIGIGEISNLEMVNLQMEMAKLNKEEQRRMLGRLVRAMNAGELKGHL